MNSNINDDLYNKIKELFIKNIEWIFINLKEFKFQCDMFWRMLLK